MKVNIMDTSKPYEIRPASEGGFVVMTEHYVVPGQMPLTVAAFSNAADLIGWLAAQHSVSIAFNEPAQTLNIERSLTWDEARLLDPEYSQRLVPRQVAEPSELAAPDGPMMPWAGKYVPDAGKGLACIARLRNGDLISIHTGENDGCRWEWDGKRSTDSLDVVGYWLT